ncbi:hypothetical protein [Hyphococcus sp.]|jgi:hypothetical protein|uniref:hypothetical protein n=1 Tax=Hyphococcus sp. TaxID=2038636 RepID=UPI003D151E02
MKRLKRIQKIYDMRVQIARRDAGAAQRARLAEENALAEMDAALTREVDGCDSIERAPFDFAARYYRATANRMQKKRIDIEDASRVEIETSATLQQRYKEQKEFDIFVSRREGALTEQKRRKADEAARQFFTSASKEFTITGEAE